MDGDQHRNRETVTILTPCFNEAAGIQECYAAVKRVFDEELPEVRRIHLFIDNASTDDTVAILRGIAEGDPDCQVIVNSRNFGLSRSPYYGLLQMQGDAVIPIVADLQTPPELIPEMIRLWRSGADSVIAVRRQMKEGPVVRAFRTSYYRGMSYLTSEDEHAANFIGFGLFSRRVVETLGTFDDPAPYFRGMVFEVGFPKAFVYYDQPLRRHGKSRHNFMDKFELAALGLTSSTAKPLYLMTILGVVIGLLSALAGLGYLVAKLLFWNTFEFGLAPITISILMLGAVQLFTIGMVGLYVDVILRQTRRRPLVVEAERVNC